MPNRRSKNEIEGVYMKILSLCSLVINNKLQLENADIDIIECKSIINQLYLSSDKTSDADKKIKNIYNIDKKYDYIILDVLSILEEYIIYKNTVILKDESIKSKDKRYIRILSDEKVEIFLQIINVIINELVKYCHISKIILTNLEIDENEQYCNNNLIDVDLSTKEYIRTSNKLIKNISESLIKDNPGLTVSKKIKLYYSDQEEKFNIVDSVLDKFNIEYRVYPNEKIHRSLKNIRYYFERAKIFNKNKLIVIFSAFSQDNPKYNYVKTLKAIDCNKLYILDDYGEKGSYYLGLDGNFDIETSVMSLITKIMRDHNILHKDVITMGSSKGGSAAIYYGFKYNFKEVIAGAPQYKIGTYLMDLSIKTYGKDIFGELTEANRLKYDNLIRKVIPNNSKTKISILTSDGDNQYERVLKDIEFILDKNNVNFIIEKCDINNHNEIAKVFTEYSYEKLTRSLNGKGCINNKLINKINNIIRKLTIGGQKWKDKEK